MSHEFLTPVQPVNWRANKHGLQIWFLQVQLQVPPNGPVTRASHVTESTAVRFTLGSLATETGTLAEHAFKQLEPTKVGILITLDGVMSDKRQNSRISW